MSVSVAAPQFSPVGAPARRPMVLFVIPGEDHGSSMIFVRRQASSLAREGVDVALFYLGSRTSPGRLMEEFRRFRRELKKISPDVVHAHFGTMTALFAALAAGARPLVITYRGGDLNAPPASAAWTAKARAFLGHFCSQLAALRARRMVCVSEQLRRRLWWRRAAASVLPTGVDPEVFHPVPRSAARRKLGWSEAERVVLFNAGHDARVKRLDLARAAADEARRMVPALRLEILDGSAPPDLIPVLMNAADCLLVTSFSEGSPTVIQEALASDLPIVSVEVGDAVERLRGVRDSTIAPPDAKVLGRAIASLVEPPRRSNGSAWVAEFSASRIARELKQIYCHAMERL